MIFARNLPKLSESQAYYFSKVAERSKEVPELKEAIDSGKLSLSKARRIVPVITTQNPEVWIEKAATLTQYDLEKEVAAVNPRAVQEKIKPVSASRHELRLGMAEEMTKKWDRALSLVSQKRSKNVSFEECLEELLEVYLERKDPVRLAERVRKEPARVFPRKENGTPRNSRFTELHHIRPLSMGGGHSVENIMTICSQHHAMVHHRAGLAHQSS